MRRWSSPQLDFYGFPVVYQLSRFVSINLPFALFSIPVLLIVNAFGLIHCSSNSYVKGAKIYQQIVICTHKKGQARAEEKKTSPQILQQQLINIDMQGKLWREEILRGEKKNNKNLPRGLR